MFKKISFFILNIKLQNSLSHENKTLRYRELISKLSKDKVILKLGKTNTAIIMYSSYGDIKTPYLYGRMAKGIHLPGEEIDVIKGGTQSKESNDPNSIKLPNVARYIFVPKAHRLCVEKIPKGPLPLDVEKYIKNNLKKYLKKDEKLEVVLEKDEKTINKILNAKSVFEIDYKISYTNEDIASEMDKLFDNELKESNIGKIEVKAKADNDINGLKVKGTPLLEGGIKLAESNGEVKRAVIIPKGKNKKETVSNESKPKILEIEDSGNLPFWQIWYKKIMDQYRPNAE